MNKKAFTSLCVAIFVSMLGLGIISPLMSLYAKSLGATGFWLGMMYSGFSISRTIILPFAGWLADSRGRKGLMIAGLTGYTIISVLYAATSTIYQLTAVRLLHGVASAMVIPIAQAYVGDLIPKGKEGTYMNLYSMVMFVGMGTGPLLGGVLSDMFPVQVVFYTMGGFAAIALLLLILFVPNLEPRARQAEGARAPLIALLRDNKMKAVSMFMASRAVFRQSLSAFLPLFAVDSLGMSRSMSGVIVSVFQLTEGVSGGFFGPMCDRMNKRTMLLLGAFVAPLLLFFLPGMNTAIGMLVILMPVALLGGLSRAPAMAYNVEAGARYGRMGSAMGIVNSAMAGGNLFGPMVSGYIIDHYSVGSVFYFGAVIGVVATFFVAYWLFRKDKEVAKGLAVAVESKSVQTKD